MFAKSLGRDHRRVRLPIRAAQVQRDNNAEESPWRFAFNEATERRIH